MSKMKFKIGDFVRIINKGYVFLGGGVAGTLGATKFNPSFTPKNGTIGKVIRWYEYPISPAYLLEIGDYEVAIDEKGVESAEDPRI